MVDNPPERFPREGTPLGRSVDNVWFGHSYSTETPRSRKLWWRIRGVLHWPVKNSAIRHR